MQLFEIAPKIKETPLMTQYNAIKARYVGALVLFRVGDFYETFGQDAITASGILGITLTKRGNGSASEIELAGFPHHSLDVYLPKLVKAGQRVAICDQVENPKDTKTLVKRDVTELVTPGVSYKDSIIDSRTSNYLCAIFASEASMGIAFVDISTGEFLTTQGDIFYIDKILQTYRPSEIIYAKSARSIFDPMLAEQFYTFEVEDWVFGQDYTTEQLLKHFGTVSLKGFGISDLPLGVIAAGACLHYLKDTQHHNIGHIAAVKRIEEDEYVWLDRFTIQNLELVGSQHQQATSLIQILDHTTTPMGARRLSQWLLMPLKNLEAINARQEVVKCLVENHDLHLHLRKEIQPIGDIERLIGKIALMRANPREVVQLKRSLLAISAAKTLLQTTNLPALMPWADRLNPCLTAIELIHNTLQEEVPALISKGGVIKKGTDAELDELRDIAFGGKDYLMKIKNEEAIRTGISSLKIAYNGVFGYFLEVSNTHKDKVPKEWIRKQTLVNAERYITPELKVYEEKILGAEEKIQVIEERLYQQLISQLQAYIAVIQENARLIAEIDVLHSLATVAKKHQYNAPTLTHDVVLDIKNGRHPVIEQNLPLGESYIPNDVYLDNADQQIIIITGPNMSGKSAILRQTAIITLMAQIGSFVPATSAIIGLVDKIFTRVGASDNISLGESTFMVEMNETASILNNISERSLILLDEIGRGTSTYDGISIAWAIAEFLHQQPLAKPRTLFATHYHELNELAAKHPRIKNYHVQVQELTHKVLFLRKLIPGGSEHSFGIHVAKMAGMPTEVLNRANEILLQLEASRSQENSLSAKTKKIQKPVNVYTLDQPEYTKIKEALTALDLNALTPIEALMKLNELKGML